MPDQSPTDLRYTMTLDDLVDGARLVQRSFRRGATILGVVVAIAGVVVVSDSSLGLAMIGYGVLDLALIWARPVERFLLRQRVARLIGNKCEIALTDDALRFRQGGVNGEIAWSALTGIREDARTLALVSGGVARMGIPKRAFGSEAHLAAFRRQVAAKIASAQRQAAGS